MWSALKSEYRKLLTVRTTYILTAFALLFLGIIAFYAQGLKASPTDLLNPHQLATEIMNMMSLTIFGAIVAILLVTHEYRYNTVTYTLTSSDSRTVTLIAKIIVISTYSLALALAIGVLAPLLTIAGVHLHGLSYTVHQQLPYWNLAWRGLFYSWASGMIGLVIATLVRVQVAAISALFVIPTLVEPLLGLLLHANVKYLPFTALDQVTGSSDKVSGTTPLTALTALGVVMIYLVVGWLITWFLFLERDAL